MLSLSYRATRRLLTARLASTLVISDPLTASSDAPSATQSAVTAAKSWPHDVVLVTVGDKPPLKTPQGISRCIHVPTKPHPVPETVAAAVKAAVESIVDTEVIVGASTKFGSTVIPIVGGILGRSPVTDIVSIVDTSKFRRNTALLKYVSFCLANTSNYAFVNTNRHFHPIHVRR